MTDANSLRKTLLFERIFWLITLIPIASFAGVRTYSLLAQFIQIGYTAANITGIALGVVIIAFVGWLAPINRLFCAKNIFILLPVMLLAGICFAGIMGETIVFGSIIPAGIGSFHTLLCRLGAGFACGIAIVISLNSLVLCLPKPTLGQIKPGFWLYIALSAMGLLLFLGSMRVLYYWDNTIFHLFSRSLQTSLRDSVSGAIKEVYNSIVEWDYNMLPAMLPALFMRIFGSSRGIFLISVFIFYFIPASLVLYMLNRLYQKQLDVVINRNIPYLFSIAFLPVLLYLGNLGYVDAGGLALIGLTLFIYFYDKINIYSRLISCGFLLFIAILFRRWFMFWSAAFVVCVAIDQLIICLRSPHPLYRRLVRWVLRCKALGVVFFGSSILFFEPLIITKYLKQTLSSAYSAYKQGILRDIAIFSSAYGLLPILLTLAGTILLICTAKTRRIAIFITVQAVLCLIIFERVQTHDMHHTLLYVPYMFSIICMSMIVLFKRLSHGWRRAVSVILIAFAAINYIPTFITAIPSPGIKAQSQTGSKYDYPYFTSLKFQHKPAENADKLFALVRQLDSLTEGSNKKVIVLASSYALNTGMLEYSDLSFNLSDNIRTYMLQCRDVDRRDGFNINVFLADYVVVPSVAQTHLAPDSQRIITIPCQYFYQNKGFATAFEPVTTMSMGDFNVTIYERTRPITDMEKSEVMGELADCYPDLPELFPRQPKID